jgi:hypothetical protein
MDIPNYLLFQLEIVRREPETAMVKPNFRESLAAGGEKYDVTSFI